MMQDINLSICIPTYNRCHAVKEIVNEILLYDKSDIEIVVLDNASNDDTVELLKEIKDHRLKIYVNEQNIGGLLNGLHVLQKGKGKFLLFLLDKDFIDHQYLEDFISYLLRNENISSGYCCNFSKRGYDVKIAKKGFEALLEVGYLNYHPSGYFFNKKHIDIIDYIGRFSDTAKVNVFALEYVLSELSLLGNSLIYNKPIMQNQKVKATKSFTTLGNNENAYFKPLAQMKMAINYTFHIDGLDLDDGSKKKMIMVVFQRGLNAATYGYKSLLNDKSACKYFGIAQQKLTLFDSIVLLKNFFIGYMNELEKEIKYYYNNRVSFVLNFVFSYLKLKFERIGIKIVRHIRKLEVMK